jgi:hypothetical protein
MIGSRVIGSGIEVRIRPVSMSRFSFSKGRGDEGAVIITAISIIVTRCSVMMTKKTTNLHYCYQHHPEFAGEQQL